MNLVECRGGSRQSGKSEREQRKWKRKRERKENWRRNHVR